MLHRRTLLTTAATAGFIPAAPAILRAEELPGVTATEIRLGNTMPYSGPASAYGTIGKAMAAMFRMANDQGGFAGRKVNFISYDDSYSPPKTVEQTRRLIEEDKVAALFATLGHADELGDRTLRQSEEGAASVSGDRRRQMGRLQGLPVDDRLAAQLRHGIAGLCQIHSRAEARREDRHPVSERRFRERLPARRAGRPEGQLRQAGHRRVVRGHRRDDRQSTRDPAIRRRRCADDHRHAEIRGPGDPQGAGR